MDNTTIDNCQQEHKEPETVTEATVQTMEIAEREGELLSIRGLRAASGDGEILRGVDLTIRRGETHVLMGPNGAGKSTLANVIMGNPAYEVTAGSIRFRGEDLLSLRPDQRGREGLFLSFQNPPEVPGISLENFLRTALEQRTGKRIRLWDFWKSWKEALKVLQMDESFAARDLNVGFSGGEKKKAEILQLLLLRPALAILDETDSGLDVDAVRTVSRGVEEFRKDRDASLLIITHSTGILSALHVDAVHILSEGQIVKNGGADLIEEIRQNGFGDYAGKGEASLD